ncbi:MAG TPA: YkgJ family cysteine cluster protein, partial [Polyangia bacterium]
VVQWDYARPYRLRKREDHYCAHSEPETRRCNIYDQRPAVCRTYDCRDDKRIWVDFDKRILQESS